MTVVRKSKLNSFSMIERGDWLLKMSILDDYFILLVIKSKYTDQVLVRHFLDDTDASAYIEEICVQSGRTKIKEDLKEGIMRKEKP